MSKIYSKMPDECTARVVHLLKLFHPELAAVQLRIDLLSVTNEDGELCLKHQGYPAAAVVRIVDSKSRTMGRGDAEIVIDEASYLPMSDAEKDALLDHELYHIELKEKNGVLQIDEHGRPKLKMRKHDVQAGWFAEIAERHGAASMERKQAFQISLAGQQTFFAFDRQEHFAIAEANVKQIEAAHKPSDRAREVFEDIKAAPPAVQRAAIAVVSAIHEQNQKAETSADYLRRAEKFERKGKA